MRDIKFRTYVRFLREMHEVREMILDKGAVMIDAYQYGLDKDDAPVMQYTGLKDVNGVEIYEGDIVRIAMDIGATIRAEVMYECGSFWLFSHEIHYVFDEDQDNMIQLGSVCLEGDCYEDGCLKVIDVVGNIHQNREILEGDK